MGLFSKVLGTGIAHPTFWKDIETEEDLNTALETSNQHKIAIFKHSTRCPISRMVLRNFEKQVEQEHPDVIFYYLDLLKHRNLSNKIEADLEVVHQSPQLIVVQNKQAVTHASHQSIDLSLV